MFVLFLLGKKKCSVTPDFPRFLHSFALVSVRSDIDGENLYRYPNLLGIEVVVCKC